MTHIPGGRGEEGLKMAGCGGCKERLQKAVSGREGEENLRAPGRQYAQADGQPEHQRQDQLQFPTLPVLYEGGGQQL